MAPSIQPRRFYHSEREIYYTDHEEEFWLEMSGKQLDSGEVTVPRLDAIKHLHPNDVYEKVPIDQCWNSIG